MNALDNQKVLEKFNRSRVADSIRQLPEQLHFSYQEAKKIVWPKIRARIKNVVVCGMGGSNLASELLRAVFGEQIVLPFVLTRSYQLPKFVGPDSLVVVSSYSGDTEEALSCLTEARAKKAMIFCLTAGGRLAKIAEKQKLPFYRIKEKYNPSRQPRYGVGSQLGALLAVFGKLGIIRVSDQAVLAGFERLNNSNRFFGFENPTQNNSAKKLARQFFGKLPVLVAAEHLSANAHILNNQINESAKNFAAYALIPELNHYLLEGLLLPKEIKSKIKILFLTADSYSAKIQKRFWATQKVLGRQKIGFIEYFVISKGKLDSALEVFLFGSWFSFYLAVLNGQNPAQVPWVDYFKKSLR